MRGFLPTRNVTRINVRLALSYLKLFMFLMENWYVQFDGIVYQHKVVICIEKNYTPLIANLDTG